MAKPVSILGDVRGMARDYSLDQLPKGYVWDLVNYIPRRRGARLDGRRAWKFLTPASAMAGFVWGGYHAPFAAGTSLLIAAGGNVYSVDPVSGAASSAGALFASGKQNGRMLRQRVYFADGAGAQKPKYVTRSGAIHTVGQVTGANAPAGSLLAVYRDRLLVSGNPASPQTVYFSPLESDTTYGPPSTGTWDPKSQYDTSLAVTAIWPMSAQILCFHDGSIEKLRGTKPAQTLADGDFALDPFTDQVGCSDPASVVGWQENVVWAAPRGVYLSDGSTIRSLTEQGGISELWRTLYNQKRVGTAVTAAVFLDLLFVSVLTDWDGSYPYDLRPFTLVCDLNERSWYRFANMGMTAAIASQTDAEEVWWGSDGANFASNYQNRLARFSDMMFTESEVSTRSAGPLLVTPTPVDQIDGNAVPMLPQIETGFLKLGPEGRKRFRNILVSHTTEMAAASPTTNKLRIGYRLRPYPYVPFTTVGDIPGIDGYKRYRVRLDKAGYGISVKVEQTIPTAISRLHDIAIDLWALDRGHL
jgi:hypothetical protein